MKKEKKVLDTSVLIRWWKVCRARTRVELTPALVRGWARELIAFYKTDAIVTPVYLEMIAGVTDQEELRLTRAFLGEFRCIDEGHIPQQDWQEALRLAQRVPRDAKPRQLGDCLIRAIANRLKHKVTTHDTSFPT
jgi:predicted nucleic acid-binding protein